MDTIVPFENRPVNEGELIERAEQYCKQLLRETPSETVMDEMVNIGLSCIENQAGERAGSQLIEQAAIKGNAKAQYNLGCLYYEGQCIRKDLAKAFTWFTRSAEQGYLDAVNNLGECYLNGYGCVPDIAKGFNLIRKAAERNNPEAMEGMGHCFFLGTGTERDLEQAKYWWQKAAAFGNRLSYENLLEHFGYDPETVSILPYHILMNAFNSTDFSQFVELLSEDVVYESRWHQENIIGKEDVVRHLSTTSQAVWDNNAVMRAYLAEIVDSAYKAALPEGVAPGAYCLWMETFVGNAVVVLEGNDKRIRRVRIMRSDTVQHKPVDTYDMMTREEIHLFGLDIVRAFLEKEEYKIRMVNRKYGSCPQILAEKEGVRYAIAVETEVAPFTGRLVEGLRNTMLKYVENQKMEACFASVGIGSSNRDLFHQGLAIRGDGFFVRYEGLEILRAEKIH